MKKALRVGYHRYYKEAIFQEHLEYIKKNISVIDEITLFAEFCHYGYWDLEYSANNAEILKDRIRRYKEIGVKSVGINLLSTIGHGDEGWSVLPRADLQYQVFPSGVETKGLLCFNNDAYLDYIAKRYALYANTGADFIWMDDDIRSPNGCFCDSCIEKFNKSIKTNLSRSELVEHLECDETWRARWRSFVDGAIQKVLVTIKNAVQDTNPNVKMGYMSIAPNAKPQWIAESGAVKGRPGGGFYDERSPLEVFRKAFDVQQQIAHYPDHICDIQYEYEAFNYQSLNRSFHFSELETTLALMSGCSGVLYNNDIFHDRQKLTDMLSVSAKKWEILVEANHNCKPAGVYCTNPNTAKLINEIGLPVTASLEHAAAAVVLGEEWKVMSDEEIRQIIEKNVLNDGKGLEILTERGFDHYCGGQIKAVYDNGMAERFGHHSLNGEYKDHYRDVFMNFSYYINNSGNAYTFAPSEKAETVSSLETLTHEPSDCSLYIFEHESGSRFAADGYLFPNSLCTEAKKEQLGNVIDWLAGNKLPVRIKVATKIMPSVMADSHGDMNIMLTNASFDPVGSFECVVRSGRKFQIIGANSELLPIEQRISEGEISMTIPGIGAWGYVLLTNVVCQQG